MRKPFGVLIGSILLLSLELYVGSIAKAQLSPFPGSKVRNSGPDPVGIGKSVATTFQYTIYLDAGFDKTKVVKDVAPAEFDVTGLTPSCGSATSIEDTTTTNKLRPDKITWTLTGCNNSVSQSLLVTVKTDPNPGHAKRKIPYYEPTSCGPLSLNNGAYLATATGGAITALSNSLLVAACPAEGVTGCNDVDHDGWSATCGDCNDNNGSAYPGALEVCGDQIDNNCDGSVDEGCPPPPPLCSTNPELCDGIDNNCNDLVDEGCPPPPPPCSDNPELCDGADNNCNQLIDEGCPPPPPPCSANQELCDGVDNNCDGQVDEGCPPPCSTNPEICNLLDDNCNGLADEGCPPPPPVRDPTETCGDNLDNTCDGQVDEGCPPPCSLLPEQCDQQDNNCNGQIDEGCPPECIPDPAETCGDNLDNTCDDQIDEDCPPLCAPEPMETCGDNLDNNCDGFIDEGCPPVCAGSPGDLEICGDNLDNNCDGFIDEGCGPLD